MTVFVRKAKLVLDTGGANKRARELYQHLGFIEESVKLTKPL